MTNDTKTCRKCGEEKDLPAFEFRKDSGTYRLECKKCRKKYRKDYYEKNKLLASEQAKEWRKNNYEHWQKSRAKYYQKNKENFANRTKKWRVRNKPKLAEYARKMRTKPYYKVREAHRSLMRRTLDGAKRDLGYTKEELKSHIESLFQDGMCWENYGEWEIDHIKPVKAFWDEGVTDAKIVNALSNLQPLWKKDNRSKSSSWVD